MWLNTNSSYNQWYQLYFRHWQSERKLLMSPSLYTSNHATYLTWQTFTPFWQDARGTCVSSTYLHCGATSVNIGSYTYRGIRVTFEVMYFLQSMSCRWKWNTRVRYQLYWWIYKVFFYHILEEMWYIWLRQSCDSLSVTFLIRMSFNKSQISKTGTKAWLERCDDVWQTDWKYTQGGNELQIERSEMRYQVWKEILLK